ncbi:MAG TPA: vanadium-dependent haloperoxidase [Caldimonas sp.]|nr:vanadium-dependent haloperoxidase [Caldimonas sp.]
MSRPTRRIVCLAFFVALLAPWPLVARADAALDWLTTVDEATVKVTGLRGERARTIAWLAAFNALDAIDPRYRPYPPAPAPLPADVAKPSRDAALAAALYTALVVEADADHALLVRRYRDTLAAVKAAGERDAGAILGQQAALMLLAARSTDRLGRIEPQARPAAPGVFVEAAWAKTPRSVAAASLAPFGVRSPLAFDPGPPPAPGSDVAGREIAEVRALGGAASSARSAEQTAAALFWASGDPSDFSTWLKGAIDARKLDALDVARIAALDAMIGIDTGIVGTTLKERYLHWRPESAIAGPFAADRDDAWRPMMRAPNSPQYPSTGATAAGIFEIELPRLVGVDGPIEWRNSQTQQVRRWPNAAALADEFGASRVWAGAHFRSAIDAGRRVGRQVASEILDRQLLPR